MASASWPAILQGDGLAVGSDAILSVGAPVNATTGLAHVEAASRIDEHLLAAEKAAVVQSRGLGFIIVGQHPLCSFGHLRAQPALECGSSTPLCDFPPCAIPFFCGFAALPAYASLPAARNTARFTATRASWTL